jgi:hypothetical protein
MICSCLCELKKELTNGKKDEDIIEHFEKIFSTTGLRKDQELQNNWIYR